MMTVLWIIVIVSTIYNVVQLAMTVPKAMWFAFKTICGVLAFFVFGLWILRVFLPRRFDDFYNNTFDVCTYLMMPIVIAVAFR